MSKKGPTLELSDDTLRSLNLQLVKVEYSKPVMIPSVWSPSGLLSVIHNTQEYDIVTESRFLLIRPEEIPNLKSHFDSLETNVPIPPYSILKPEYYENKQYLVLESCDDFPQDAKHIPSCYNLTKRALELLRKLPRVAAFFRTLANGCS